MSASGFVSGAAQGAAQQRGKGAVPLFRRRVRSRRSGSATVSIGDNRRRHVVAVAPLELVVADDFRLSANDRFGAAIALREPAAEVVDRRFAIETDGGRVLAHE